MGGGESKNSQLLKYGGLLSEAERETLRAVFGNIAGDTEATTASPQQFKNYFSQIGVTGEFGRSLFKAFCTSDGTAAKTPTDTLMFVNFIQNASNILKGSTAQKATFFCKLCQHSGDGTAVTCQNIQAVLLLMLSFLTDSELVKKIFPESHEWKHNADCNKVLADHLLKMLLDTFKGDVKDTVSVSGDKIEQWLRNCSLLLRIYEVVFTILLFGQKMAVDDIRRSLGASTEVEDGEEMITENFLYPLKLPPITHGHNDKFSSLLLDRTLVMALNSFIPASLRGKLYPLFSSVKHGESFSAMCSRAINKGPTLLIVRDTKGYVFGVFAAVSWKFGPQFFGNSDCFLFTLLPQLGVYYPSGYNTNYLYLQQNAQTLPNGLGAGGQLDYYGLWLSAEYGVGHSKAKPACTTYSSPILSSSEEFAIDSVEVWGVGTPKLPEGKDKSILDKDPEARYLLELAGKAQHSKTLSKEPEDDT